MTKRTRNLFLFTIGALASAVGLPILYATGVPSFSMVLAMIFGEGNVWALVFSAIIVGVLLMGIQKAIKNYA